MTGAAPPVCDFSGFEEKSPALRVLIVDDEPLIRWSLSETLTGRGFEVYESGDGAGAIERLIESPESVDVVLLDYRLPDTRDLSLLFAIRRVVPATPVILMTAYGTPELAGSATDAGAYRVVNKPFDMNDVAELVLQAHTSRPPGIRRRNRSRY